jgi:hypothetical protein
MSRRESNSGRLRHRQALKQRAIRKAYLIAIRNLYGNSFHLFVMAVCVLQVSMANQKNRGEPGGGGVSPPTWGAVTAWPGPSSATPWPGQPAASQGVTGT